MVVKEKTRKRQRNSELELIKTLRIIQDWKKYTFFYELRFSTSMTFYVSSRDYSYKTGKRTSMYFIYLSYNTQIVLRIVYHSYFINKQLYYG